MIVTRSQIAADLSDIPVRPDTPATPGQATSAPSSHHRAPSPIVRAGQVWADCDPRNAGRTLRVARFEYHTFTARGVPDGQVPYAVCTVLTQPDQRPWALTGHQVTIRVSRMRPTSNGYRLVEDAP